MIVEAIEEEKDKNMDEWVDTIKTDIKMLDMEGTEDRQGWNSPIELGAWHKPTTQ